MNKTTIAKLDAGFAKHPVLVAGPASDAEIAQIEASIGFSLPSDYREFVARYGGFK